VSEHARVVVVGGGNMGAGVLYHLAHEGWTDCILLEKAELTSGATWHAAGLVSRMISSHSLGSLHDYAVDLYKRIEQETGQAVSWHNCGSLRVATSADHVDWIRHIYDIVTARGQEIHFIGPDEIKRLNPLYDVAQTGIVAGIYTPDDGHVDPAGACQALCAGARKLGAKIRRRCRATGVAQLPSGEWRVDTEAGSIICEHVVNAGGYHARQIGAWSGLSLPITAMQHHYVVTDEVPEFASMEREIPVTRDDFFSGYIRREQRSVLIGLYDRQDPKPKWLQGCPWDSESELFAPDWDAITPWLDRCFNHCPTLMERGIKRVVNGGITYTPDGSMILGPAPGLRNYWLICGATVGIAWGPGAGRTLAQWMVHGGADVSTRAFDPRRFGIWADGEYARRRAIEDYATRIALPFPAQQSWSCRDIKRSGAHERTRSLGAVYEEAGGWERPRWYARVGIPAEDVLSYRRGANFELIGAECRAVREHIGIGDFSAFTKFEVSGPDADSYLNRICANRMPRRIGGTALTQILNYRGRIEGEATVVRLAEDRFYLVTGAPSERRIWDWLAIHERGHETVTLTNRTDEIGIIVVAGPKARDLLARCGTDDFSFPWLTARQVMLGGTEVLAVRLSFTGDLAWELHAPNSTLGALWDLLYDAGEENGVRPFGSFALNSLRLEKGYRGGSELTNDATPIDAGLARLVKLDKEFVGKPAILAQIQSGPAYRLVLLELIAADLDVLGGEPILESNRVVGSVSSGAYGHFVRKNLALAYLNLAKFTGSGRLSVTILGERYPAAILDEVPFDPRNERLRS